jgi:PAS domain S-box-containing protein
VIQKKIPVDIWKAACENIREPLAIVGLDNSFVWVNNAFEQLTGYPKHELLTKTWIDITITDDVGDDLLHVKNIINGRDSNYVMDKRYMHRKGHEIDVTIIVRRWPNEPEAITMFYVEAIPPSVTKYELEDIVEKLTTRIVRIESDIPLPKGEANEALKIRYFAIGFLALIGMMMYLFYCLVMLQLKQVPNAPNGPTIQNVTEVGDTQLCLRQ